jgi:glycerol kinase
VSLLFSCRRTKANYEHFWAIGIKNARVLCPQVSLLYPQPGYVEIDPDALWSKVVAVVKEAISGENSFLLYDLFN